MARRGLALLLCVLLAAAGSAHAARQPAKKPAKRRWGMSLLLGVHAPRLKGLKDGLYRSPLIGTASVLLDPQGSDTESVNFRVDNPLSPHAADPATAFELQWQLDGRNWFFLGLAEWDTRSTATTAVNVPLQRVRRQATARRHGNLNYNAYYLGWKRVLWVRRRVQVYGRLAFHELFDVDYKEVQTLSFPATESGDAFTRNIVFEAQTAAVLLGEVGGGLEWRLLPWLTLGVEGRYLHTERPAKLHDARLLNDFLGRDDVDLKGLPAVTLPDRFVGYLPEETDTQALADADSAQGFYRRLELDFGGWQLLARLTFYF